MHERGGKMIKIIILIFVWFLQNIFAYKFIKRIDKKERIKLNEMEEKHINYMLEKENQNV